MNCPRCNSDNTKCYRVESIDDGQAIARVRICLAKSCGHSWRTTEVEDGKFEDHMHRIVAKLFRAAPNARRLAFWRKGAGG